MAQITISSNVVSIGDNAFWGCSKITQIIIPSSVVSIGNHVFLCCRNLKEITIPSSVTEIGTEVFTDCSSLRKIDIPNFIYKKLDGINTVLGHRTLGLDSDSNAKILVDGKELDSSAKDSMFDKVSAVSVSEEPKPLQANELQKNMDEH